MSWNDISDSTPMQDKLIAYSVNLPGNKGIEVGRYRSDLFFRPENDSHHGFHRGEIKYWMYLPEVPE